MSIKINKGDYVVNCKNFNPFSTMFGLIGRNIRYQMEQKFFIGIIEKLLK